MTTAPVIDDSPELQNSTETDKQQLNVITSLRSQSLVSLIIKLPILIYLHVVVLGLVVLFASDDNGQLPHQDLLITLVAFAITLISVIYLYFDSIHQFLSQFHSRSFTMIIRDTAILLLAITLLGIFFQMLTLTAFNSSHPMAAPILNLLHKEFTVNKVLSVFLPTSKWLDVIVGGIVECLLMIAVIYRILRGRLTAVLAGIATLIIAAIYVLDLLSGNIVQMTQTEAAIIMSSAIFSLWYYERYRNLLVPIIVTVLQQLFSYHLVLLLAVAIIK